MAELILNVFVDGLMALLLIITIFYCWKLNVRIKILQDSKSELAQIIRQFDESTQMATRSIGEIHDATARISENIQHKIDKANYLADDLQFMIEKGNKIADRMDGGISANRSNAANASKPSASSSRPAGRAERAAPDLDENAAAKARVREAKAAAMKMEDPKAGATRSRRSEPAGGTDSAKKSLESVLQRVNKGRGENAEPEDKANAERGGKRPAVRLRSKSEQELFDALKEVGEV